MRLLLPIFANLSVVFAATGFGYLLKQLLPRDFSRVDRLAFTILGGLGLLGAILFCVGQIWFSRTAIQLVVGLGCLLALKPLVAAVRDSSANRARFQGPAIPILVTAIVLLVAVIAGLAEITGDMNNDAVAYHYLGPKIWLREGIIRPIPDEVLTAFPATIESLYAALMSIGGERGPQSFALVAMLSTLLMGAALGMRLGLSPPDAWWTAAIISTLPVFFRGGSGGYIDTLLAGFILGAARIAFDAVRKSEYVLFGVFSGIAMSAKYTALATCALLTLCAFFVAFRFHRRGLAAVVMGLGIASAVAMLIACPAYLRNWILLGSPIYPPPPFLTRFFHAKYITPTVTQNLVENMTMFGRGMGHDFWSFLKLPFNLTYHTANFRGAGGIGIVPLALAPMGLIASQRDGFAKALALFAALQMSVWFFTFQDARYAIHAYLIAVVFGVLGWKYVLGLGTRYGRALSALVVACSILYGLVMIVSASRDDIHAALSPSFEAKRRIAETPFLESFEYLNRETSAKKILILDPYAPAYYCDKSYVKPVGRWGEETIPGATDIEAVLAQLPRLGVSHVLDVRWGSQAFRLSGDHAGLRLVFQRTDQRVYAVVPPL